MKIFYTDIFELPLPEGHRFPVEKYYLLRKRVMDAGLESFDNLVVPDASSDEDITRVHCPEYLKKLETGCLTSAEIHHIGLPWTPEMVLRARRASGATIAAGRAALQDGIAVQLAGGTHHAFRDRGEGYCVFNDSAIAARALQAQGLVENIVIIDCDVHQGNGTAAIFAADPSVFTFSIHGRKNFPHTKEQSDLDIALEDDTGDTEYLAALAEGLDRALTSVRADLAIYLAGADPYRDDRIGRLALTKEGLLQRDRLVFDHCRQTGLPIAVTMSGGYARTIEDTVDIQFRTVQTAKEYSDRGMGRGLQS